ncbi:ESCRT-II complex subunit-domain-containing protein [Radiomyces spectabilis]|uniref:ESCRT-II complex subunit-domain-containing protein n=1 Tax=Radiomyces spectabilis TaxID=64574 RepID=UPI00222004C7|nr:ESCRT-II complex subunit-domain-containing protein [Radiomyces spectabilis]KAI8370601.1 ESCRT-II complex subunit-domain-containing protein [Radiomyces spectabilis]
MSQEAFQFPSIHEFPPFFTRQPTEATWHSQASQWADLILSYCRYHRIYRIDLHQVTMPSASTLFENTRIKRRLSFETLQDIIDRMVDQGTADWEGGSKGDKSQALIYWRKPEDWANLIWTWVNQVGVNNSIVTVYEILHGELAEGQEFYEMDKTVLLKALNVLVKRGHAQIFSSSEDEDSMGVKFFGSQ